MSRAGASEPAIGLVTQVRQDEDGVVSVDVAWEQPTAETATYGEDDAVGLASFRSAKMLRALDMAAALARTVAIERRDALFFAAMHEGHDGAAGQRARAAIQRADAERCRETYAALEATSGCFPVATSSKAV